TDPYVVEDGHAAEPGDVLERARDPQLGPLVWSELRDVAAVEHDPSVGRRVDAADAVEDAGLAGAVGTDDGEEIPGVDLEAHPGQGGHAAEAQVQVFQSEKCHPPVTPPRCREDAVKRSRRQAVARLSAGLHLSEPRVVE